MSSIAKTLKRLTGVRLQRRIRVRSVISGTAIRPRLVVERSLRHFRAQLINDETGRTIASASDAKLDKKLTGKEQAAAVGKLLADNAKTNGITTVVFDRRHYRYHGRVQAFADAAREAGLIF